MCLHDKIKTYQVPGPSEFIFYHDELVRMLIYEIFVGNLRVLDFDLTPSLVTLLKIQ